MRWGSARALPFPPGRNGLTVAQFIRLTVDDEADAMQLQQSLEQEGARVWWHAATLQVLWPEPVTHLHRR